MCQCFSVRFLCERFWLYLPEFLATLPENPARPIIPAEGIFLHSYKALYIEVCMCYYSIYQRESCTEAAEQKGFPHELIGGRTEHPAQGPRRTQCAGGHPAVPRLAISWSTTALPTGCMSTGTFPPAGSKPARPPQTGIEIHPVLQIGRCLFIDHGMGIVFGETTVRRRQLHHLPRVTLGGTKPEDTGSATPPWAAMWLIGGHQGAGPGVCRRLNASAGSVEAAQPGRQLHSCGRARRGGAHQQQGRQPRR